jgi:hypothetical protein
LAYNYHEQRRDKFRAKYGEAYDEIKSIQAELDFLGSELHMLTNIVTSLDANFSNYGYSVYIRCYDNDLSRNAPSISGLHDENKDWESERTKSKILKIYEKVWIFDHIVIIRNALSYQSSVEKEPENVNSVIAKEI